MSRKLIIGLLLVALALHTWPILRWLSALTNEPPAFDVPAAKSLTDNDPPFFSEGFINPVAHTKMVHVGSICELKGGGFAAIWYGGSREGAGDTALYFSTIQGGMGKGWSKPKVIVDAGSASTELRRFVKKVGNSIIFADPEDRLWLVYVTICLGGWSDSSLNVKVSADQGKTWKRSQRLTLSPFFNISELVRNRPLRLRDGGFFLPVYHECLGKFPEALWFHALQPHKSILYRKTRMAGGKSFIQPSVVAYGSRFATAFYRSCSAERTVAMATTEDAGLTWSDPQHLRLPNPDSGLSAILLSQGRIILAFNDSKYDRGNLRLAVSSDGGAQWITFATIEDQKGQEFSYPYLIRSKDGRVHLVYTWRRKHIKHVVFNEAWIDSQIKKASE